MIEYKRQPNDCPPAPKNPAVQPHPPGGTCDKLPTTTPPERPKVPDCPPPPSDCHCPKPPTSTPDCLEKLITKQAADIALGKKSEAFKADLEKMLVTARQASLDYTRTTYEDLVKEWVRQDVNIASLIRKVVCAIPCWRCIVECYICPLLNQLHQIEGQLYGDGTLSTDVHTLYDLLYWYGRDRDAKDRRVARIKSVVGAWDKPAATIAAALKQDETLWMAIDKAPGSDAGKVIYDLFFRLIPMHLAIAPPAGSAWTTKIGIEFTEFCGCDTGTPDNCCGPDVGELSLRQRLTGPQPYLVDPNDFFQVICCLVENRLKPAHDAAAQADADWSALDAEIKRLKAQLENGIKKDAFEKAAKGAIPGVIDCCDHQPDDDQSSAAR
jgi:hypothetical protein